jgi:hypothetical protein
MRNLDEIIPHSQQHVQQGETTMLMLKDEKGRAYPCEHCFMDFGIKFPGFTFDNNHASGLLTSRYYVLHYVLNPDGLFHFELKIN